MTRISLGAAWIAALSFVVACSSGEGTEENPSGASSGVENAGGTASNASGGDGSLGETGGGISFAGTTSVGDGGQSSGAGGSGTGAEANGGSGGSSETAAGGDTEDPPPDGTGGSDTEDPPPDGTGGGSTEDPPPPSGGTGQTEDPPPGDTDDPPPGDTDDPPPGDTDDPPPGDTDDPPPGDTQDPPTECIPTEMLNVNVIVFGEADPGGADSEGRMYVGGDAFLEGYAVGSKEETNCDRWDLVVGGDLTVSGGTSVSNGKVAVAGDVYAGVGFNAACGIWNETPVDFEALRTEMIRYSQAMAGYEANGEAVVEHGALILTGTDPDLNIFSITAEDLSNNLSISVPDDSSVIVNVSGTDVIWSGVGFELPDGGAACRGESSDWCHSIMYNFPEAETLSLSGIGVQGSIMAPYATFDGGGGNVDGQLVVDNLYGGIEFHPYFFTGCLILPDGAPTT